MNRLDFLKHHWVSLDYFLFKRSGLDKKVICLKYKKKKNSPSAPSKDEKAAKNHVNPPANEAADVVVNSPGVVVDDTVAFIGKVFVAAAVVVVVAVVAFGVVVIVAALEEGVVSFVSDVETWVRVVVVSVVAVVVSDGKLNMM